MGTASSGFHRHRRRRDTRPARRARTTPSPTRPRRRRHPPSQGHRLRNLPFNAFQANAAWRKIVMAATDLRTWAKLIGLTDHAELARCEVETFRYRVSAARGRPPHPRRPQTTAAHRRHLALGPGNRHRLAAHPRRVHLKPVALTRPDQRPRRPWKARPPKRHRPTRHTQLPQSTPQADQNRPQPSQPAPREKSRLAGSTLRLRAVHHAPSFSRQRVCVR